MRERRFAFLITLTAALLLPQAASAQESADREKLKSNLEDTLQALDAASKENKAIEAKKSKVDKELENLQGELVDIATTMQSREKVLIDLEDSNAKLSEREKALSADLKSREGELDKMLMSMMKLSIVPPEMVLAMPGDFNETLHTAKVLGLTSSAIKERAEALKAQLQEAHDLRERIAEQRSAISDEQEKLQKNQQSLKDKLEKRGEMQEKLSSEHAEREKEVKKLAQDSKSLKDLLADLEKRHAADEARAKKLAMTPPSKPATPAAKPASRVPTSLGEERMAASKDGGQRISTPSEGKVYITYGAKDTNGDESKGIRIRTRGGAAVTAPLAGEVVYTGPFLDYGNLIIIRHDGKHHSLLAGMSSMQAKVGQKVIKGEPVGVMGNGETGTGLYVEIRKDNKPINPVPWLNTL